LAPKANACRYGGRRGAEVDLGAPARTARRTPQPRQTTTMAPTPGESGSPPAPTGAVPAMDAKGLTETPNVATIVAAAAQAVAAAFKGTTLNDVTIQAISTAATAAAVAALSQASQREDVAAGPVKRGRPDEDSGDDDDPKHRHEDSSASSDDAEEDDLAHDDSEPESSSAPSDSDNAGGAHEGSGASKNDRADREQRRDSDHVESYDGFTAIMETASFNTREEAIATIKAFAEEHGFAVVIRSSSEAYVYLICDRGRRYDERWDKSGTIRQRETATRLCGCPYSIACRYSREDGRWHVETTEAQHNHPPSAVPSVHPSLRRFSAADLERIDALRRAGEQPTQIYRILKEGAVPKHFTLQDVRNAVKKMRQHYLDGRSPTRAFLDELIAANVPCTPHFDGLGRLTHLFISYPATAELLDRFGDVLLVDATYKTNIYDMPVLEVVGITACHVGFTAACVVLPTETQPDYEWALSQLRALLRDREPRVILTDKDSALAAAIQLVFPMSAHLLCLWHVNMNVLAKAKVEISSADRANKFVELFNAMAASGTPEAYEAAALALQAADSGDDWATVVRYVNSNWLPLKEKFVRAWTSQHRHLGNVATSRVEGAHNLLKQMLHKRMTDIMGIGHTILDLFRRQAAEASSRMAAEGTRQLLLAGNRVLTPATDERPAFLLRDLLQPLHFHVSHYAIKQVVRQADMLRRADLPPCTGGFRRVWGLPCVHELLQHAVEHRPVRVQDLDQRWLVALPAAPPERPLVLRAEQLPRVVFDPAVRSTTRRQGNTKPKGKTSTQRELTVLERVDRDLRLRQRKCGFCQQLGHTRQACPRYQRALAAAASQSAPQQA